MTRPTVVLLPGLLCDHAAWAAQCAALTDAHCIVPSYGLRDSLEAMARAVLEMVTADRFALAGHSMGARVALEIVRRAAQRVDRLALFDTGLDAIAPGADGARERAQREALLALAN